MRTVLAVSLTLALGCSESGKIREWRASDHDQPDDPGQVAAPGAGGDEQPDGADVATEVLWRQQCARCHGRDGTGGTPMAASLPIANLRQSTLSEEEIVAVVTKGRRQMPGFGQELDADAIRALARKVLSLRR